MMNEPVTYDSQFFKRIGDGSLRSARIVTTELLQLLDQVPLKSVVDVGCGTGTWLAAFKELGISDIMGLDGDYVDRNLLTIPEYQFRPVDLTKPISVARRYDLAVSLEVAEHLPASSAKQFVHFLAELAPTVLFSGAVPGQTGTNHLNGQWPEYWRMLFSEHSFRMFDPIRSIIWHNEDVELWYRQNIFLFVHDSVVRDHEVFTHLPEVKDACALTLVANCTLQENERLRTLIKMLPYAVRVSASWHIKQLLARLGHGNPSTDER